MDIDKLANMPLEGSYAIWNNRGGTGKTTLTYHLANKYALKHPDKTILLIDMCPQADLSHAFLGDDENNLDYVSQIGTLKKDAMCIGEHKIPKTVSGYLDLCSSIGLPQNVDPRTFLINVSKFNPLLPRNLYLLCGDASIELISRSLEIKRNSNTLTQFGSQAWKQITTCLKQFIRKIAERKGIKLVAFIDTNSAFSISTEIALCAADKLIIPTSDDQLHRNAFEYMFALLYGFSHPSNVYYYYRHLSLYYRANEHDVQLPKIHLILNKITNSTNCSINNNNNNSNSSLLNTTTCSPQPQHQQPINGGHLTSNVITNININSNNKSDLESCLEFIYDLMRKHPQAFYLRNNGYISNTINEFKNEFVIDIIYEQETTNVVRQAVRSHSPLLPVKHHHHHQQYQQQQQNNKNNQQSSTTTSTTSAYSSMQQTPTSTTASSSSSSASSNTSSNLPYPLQHQLHITRKRLLISTIPNNNNNTPQIQTTNHNEESSIERTNALIFDRVLDRIVDRL